MNSMNRHFGFDTRRTLGLIAAIGTLAACSDTTSPTSSPFEPTDPTFNLGPGADGVVHGEEFELCKYGSSATFDVRVNGNLVQSGLVLQDGDCVIVHEKSFVADIVQVTETSAAPGFVLDHIDVTQLTFGMTNPTFTNTTITNSNSASGAVGGSDDPTYGFSGVLAEFYNVPTGGGEGCTPGYWKQPQHFDSWVSFAPTDLFSSVFNLPSALARPEQNVNPASLTLLAALELRGGDVNALMRHAVAALLNAANPDVNYDLSTAQVIAAFNAAIAGGDIEGTKDEFADFNEQGCPLN